jgi:hypothetical protein
MVQKADIHASGPIVRYVPMADIRPRRVRAFIAFQSS